MTPINVRYTLDEMLSDLRYLRANDLAPRRLFDDHGDAMVDVGLAIPIGSRLRVTDAGFGVLEACDGVVLPEELRAVFFASDIESLVRLGLDDDARARSPRPHVAGGTAMSKREPFGGRYWGIWDIDGEDGEPIALYPRKQDADAALARARGLDEDDDDYLTEYHDVFPCDIAGAWWNSYDADPRGDSPLDTEEIVAVHAGDEAPRAAWLDDSCGKCGVRLEDHYGLGGLWISCELARARLTAQDRT